MIPMKKPLPGTPSGNVARTYIPAESAKEKDPQSSNTSSDTNSAPSSTQSIITGTHSAHSAHSAPASKKVIIAIILIIAIAVGIYFLFFNKSKSKWEEYDDSDLWESETEAADYYEDF